jgi:hypothetical protein
MMSIAASTNRFVAMIQLFLLVDGCSAGWDVHCPYAMVTGSAPCRTRREATTHLSASSSSLTDPIVVEEESSLFSTSITTAKADLIRACQTKNSTEKSSTQKATIQALVDELIRAASSSSSCLLTSSTTSGWLSGEWELLYSTTDATRSSPFFWAFRLALDTADQIFAITDAIPLKEIGPAFQQIDWNDATGKGRLVSKVKVAISLAGGQVSSIMTTRATMTGVDGIDGVTLTIDTTKPEKSTILSSWLGPIGDVLSENAPAFPSGAVLERMVPGASRVVMRTRFCDETLRISAADDRPDEWFLWKRRTFADYDFL